MSRDDEVLIAWRHGNRKIIIKIAKTQLTAINRRYFTLELFCWGSLVGKLMHY